MRVANEFYHSPEWKQCRESYIKSTDGLCELCKSKGLIRKGIIVHHINPITSNNKNNPDVTLNHNNLQLLCWECHSEIHHGGTIKESRVSFDEHGNVIQKR